MPYQRINTAKKISKCVRLKSKIWKMNLVGHYQKNNMKEWIASTFWQILTDNTGCNANSIWWEGGNRGINYNLNVRVSSTKIM